MSYEIVPRNEERALPDEFYRHWNRIADEFTRGRCNPDFEVNPNNIFEKEYVWYLEGMERSRQEDEAEGIPSKFIPTPLSPSSWLNNMIRGVTFALVLIKNDSEDLVPFVRGIFPPDTEI
jgi:hypothetical protein